MITINANALRSNLEMLKSKRAYIEESAVRQYRSAILGMYWQLLLVTPQFSSDMVSNWDIEVDPGIGKRAAKKGGSPHRGYQRSSEKAEMVPGQGKLQASHNAGEQDAGLMAAYMRGVSRMRYITYYGQPCSFVNPTLLEIDSPLIFDHTGVHHKLRDGTVVTAWESISSYLQARYGAPR